METQQRRQSLTITSLQSTPPAVLSSVAVAADREGGNLTCALQLLTRYAQLHPILWSLNQRCYTVIHPLYERINGWDPGNLVTLIFFYREQLWLNMFLFLQVFQCFHSVGQLWHNSTYSIIHSWIGILFFAVFTFPGFVHLVFVWPFKIARKPTYWNVHL